MFPEPPLEVYAHPRKRPCQERALVLRAVGLPSQVLQHEGFWRLFVPAEIFERAHAELVGYDEENKGWPPPKVQGAHRSSGRRETVAYAALMILMYPIGQKGLLGTDWWTPGRVAGDLVREGEVWRTVTALTLHVDLSHLAGNLLFGVLFALVASQSLGPGLVWWGALLSGAFGNALNVVFRDPEFRSVGASTAVFGIVGLMSAFEALRRDSPGIRTLRSLGPVLGGAVLLGFLGMGGGEGSPDRVDIGAHVFGFLVGSVFGATCAWLRLPDRIHSRAQHVLAATVALPLVIAWVLALV